MTAVKKTGFLRLQHKKNLYVCGKETGTTKETDDGLKGSQECQCEEPARRTHTTDVKGRVGLN